MKRFSDIFLVVASFLFFFSLTSCNNTIDKQDVNFYKNGNFISGMNQELTEAIIGDLFPPPVASRIYVYPNVAAYEILRLTDPSLKSFAGHLKELTPLPEPEKDKDINYELASLTAFIKVGKQLVYTESGLDAFQTHKLDSLSGILDPNVLKQSVEYGNVVADHILKWASTDHYKETRSAARYSLLNTESSWIPTPPDYTPAIEPHWHEQRTFVIESSDQFRPDSLLIPFSTDKESEFYKEAIGVRDAVTNADSNQISMAHFWDDNPVVTEHTGHMMMKNKKMTPGGHWLYITMLAVRNEQINMADAAMIFSMTSIALADAFYSSWDSKFYFNLIRPVSYINKYIQPDWMPILQTPPFPEHPSAHSAVSASAALVLTQIFGDNFAFTDSSELRFDLPVRSFNSFNEAAQEVAMSRYYGGIHYMYSNEVGAEIGQKVGNAVITKLSPLSDRVSEKIKANMQSAN